MLAFHHFQPQKDGDFRGLARPQQKTQKDLSHQRPKDKFNQSEKPATSSTNRADAARVLEAVNIIVPFPVRVMGGFIDKPLLDCQSRLHPSYVSIRYKFKILSAFSIA